MTAAELFQHKTPVPSEMTSAEWGRVRLEVRERAYFMACVSQAEILQIYQDETGKYIRGDQSQADTRQALRERLAATGYAPRPGEEGGIKDLTSLRRMDVVLRTNSRMAANKAAYDKQLLALKVFPARRMVRMTPKRVPRNWRARWAVWQGTPGVNAGEMAALHTSPVWTGLSRFGAPYAPYDFGSGMGDLPVRRDEAKALGLLDGPAPAPAPAGGMRMEDGKPVVIPSFNENLQATPVVTSPSIQRKLAEDLEGLAILKPDGTLIYTDPNGTRPVPAAEVAATIATPNKADIPLHQAEVLRTWAEEGPATFTRDSNALYHFRRLIRRVEPMAGNEPLSLSRAFPTPEAREKVLSGLQPGGRWTPRAAPFPFTAFAKEDPGKAVSGDDADRAALQLILRVVAHRHAKDLTPAVDAIADEDVHGHHVLFERGHTFRVLEMSRSETAVTVTLSEGEEGAP